MIRKSVKRFSLRQTRSVCAEIMLKQQPKARRAWSMIRKSVKRFSEKIMLKQQPKARRALGQGEALAPCFLADGGNRIACLARDAGKLFVRKLEAASYDPDLHVVAQIQAIAGSAKLFAARDHVASPVADGITARRALHRLAVTGDCPAPRVDSVSAR